MAKAKKQAPVPVEVTADNKDPYVLHLEKRREKQLHLAGNPTHTIKAEEGTDSKVVDENTEK